MNIITHTLALAAGSLVTVAVFEGTARIRGEHTPVVKLDAGQARHFPSAAPKSPSAPSAPSTSTDQQRVQELEAELAKVEAALGEERFAKVLMKGQLDAERGLPTEWPSDLDTRLTAAVFPEEIEAVVAGLPGVDLVQTDCDEYPCIGVLRYTGTDDSVDWQRPIGEKIGEWAKDALDGQVSLAMSAMADGEGADAKKFIVFSAHGEDRGSNVSQRTGRRMEELEMGLGD